LLADRDGDRRAGVVGFHAADQSVRRGHRDTAHDVVADVLRDLEHERSSRQGDLDGVEDPRKLFRLELDVNTGSHDLNDFS